MKRERFRGGLLAAFRRLYPEGESYVVAGDVDAAYRRSYEDFEVTFASLRELIERLFKGKN